jgi:hypothetical protein
VVHDAHLVNVLDPVVGHRVGALACRRRRTRGMHVASYAAKLTTRLRCWRRAKTPTHR